MELVTPRRVVPILRLESLDQLESHARMRPGILPNPTLEFPNRIAMLIPHLIEPPLDGREREGCRFGRRRVGPLPTGETRDRCSQLTTVRWSSQ